MKCATVGCGQKRSKTNALFLTVHGGFSGFCPKLLFLAALHTIRPLDLVEQPSNQFDPPAPRWAQWQGKWHDQRSSLMILWSSSRRKSKMSGRAWMKHPSPIRNVHSFSTKALLLWETVPSIVVGQAVHYHSDWICIQGIYVFHSVCLQPLKKCKSISGPQISPLRWVTGWPNVTSGLLFLKQLRSTRQNYKVLSDPIVSCQWLGAFE